jgi:CRP-like cAMP-binding protein
MSDPFIKLYAAESEADCAFFLNQGRVFLYASSVDKYAISGKNLILGATEIIVREKLAGEGRRIETAVAEGGSSLKKMSAARLIEGLRNYSISLNISMVLARQVMLSNHIINANMSLLQGDEKESREVSLRLYSAVDRIRSEYDRRKLPWLKEVLKTHETSLTFKRGEAYYKSSEPVKIAATKNLSDSIVEYERGSIICEEDTEGDSMFILESGAIDVLLKGNRVATIEDSGTVFGEMALLLWAKRGPRPSRPKTPWWSLE